MTVKSLLWAALLVPAAAIAQTAGVADIYGTALGPGWQNWSWAKTELGVDIGSARKPIMVEAGGYQALYLHHDPFSTAGFKSIGFLIQAMEARGQVRVIAVQNGKPIPDKAKVVKLAAGGWTKVDVPLSVLGAENQTIDGFWIQNDGADPLPHFYVTEIALH